MAKRRKRTTIERRSRAKPILEVSKIRRRQKKMRVMPIQDKNLGITQRVNPNLLKTLRLIQSIKPAKKQKIKLQSITNIIKPSSCQKRKAKARHEYFSMRSSGNGGSRTNPKSNRFTVRC